MTHSPQERQLHADNLRARQDAEEKARNTIKDKERLCMTLALIRTTYSLVRDRIRRGLYSQ